MANIFGLFRSSELRIFWIAAAFRHFVGAVHAGSGVMGGCAAVVAAAGVVDSEVGLAAVAADSVETAPGPVGMQPTNTSAVTRRATGVASFTAALSIGHPGRSGLAVANHSDDLRPA